MPKALPFAAMLLLAVAGCKGANETKTTANGESADKPAAAKPPLTKLEIKDTKVGTGPAVANGDRLFIRYRGTLANGTEFDSTEKHGNTPFVMFLGGGQVIKGWDQGLVGMKVGGTRELSIPYPLAYGDQDKGEIPPKSDLYFTVELLDAVKSGKEQTIGRKTLKPGTGPAIKDGDTVSVKYVGELVGGAVFEDRFKDKPYTFKVGDPKVREFFHQGILGTKKGGKYLLHIPPEAGFGESGGPTVEGPQILLITVDVVNVK